MSMKEWAREEVRIACEMEREGSEDEWDYGCSCYESALKAFESLCDDGHSGMSIGFTQAILNRLIDGKPLKSITGADEEWNETGENHFQNKRMSSLFKNIESDGSVIYKDVNQYFARDINTGSTFTGGRIGNIVKELYPITLPYYPGKRIEVFVEEFLVDPKNGDWDTTGVFYLIDSKGERVEINRFFKESESGWDEITKEEYEKRKESKYKKEE